MTDALISLIQDILTPLQWSLNWVNVLEILFIAVILLLFYKKFIKNTQAEKLVKGIFFLIFAWIFSEILILIDLRILGVFLKSLVTLIALSLIVIFQPELRRFLGYLGQPGFIRNVLFSNNNFHENTDNNIDILKEIIEAVKYLTKTKTGALMVFQKTSHAGTYSDVGTRIDAVISPLSSRSHFQFSPQPQSHSELRKWRCRPWPLRCREPCRWRRRSQLVRWSRGRRW